MAQNNFGLVHGLCDGCGHGEICNKKEIVSRVQEQLKSINCEISSEPVILKLKDCKWLCVDLQCKHWIPGESVRE